MANACGRVFVWALVLLALGACSKAEPQTEELRIGVLVPVTGGAARFTSHLAGQALVDSINAVGGLDIDGRKVRVRYIVGDTGGQTERTMAVAVRLIQQDKVQVLLGPYFSREAIPVAAAAEAAQVLMLSPTASNPEVSQGRRFVFQMSLVDSAKGRLLARYAYEDLGLRRIGVLYTEGDAYSSGLAGYFTEAMSALPGAVVLKEPYPAGAVEFSAALRRLRAAKIQALLLPNFVPDLPRQITQARSAGFEGLFLGGDSWGSDQSFHVLPEAQGARYSVEFALEGLDKKARSSLEELVRQSGADLDKKTALTLDALEMLFAAARAVKSVDPVSLRSGLLSLRGFSGLTGSIRFEQGGDPVRTLRIMKIVGGKLVELKTLTPDR